MRSTAAPLDGIGTSHRFTRSAWFLAFMVMGTIILTMSAKAKVPMWPVEMSLQTLAVFTIAATFGLRLGMATVLLYLMEGALGMPVFQGTPEKGLGVAYMAGPTGGYLAGFVAATAIVGWASDRGWWRNPLKIGAAMLLGEVAILALGALWLAYLLGVDMAIAYGIGPFIVTDLVKLALAAGLATVLGGFIARLSRR
ncbi:biotin transporter BioY [Minwuia thermotolerans]|uniref:Biotin transporter n=1 Tax=Minwuia thermotolerans TaxID=2056226 RepID=A0A2M9FZG8_9PROT|nr:biotin transporter BioY [Minwuia thermotolerans]PJK28862.1 biotin transporter BioY [Minwuia thermotolerans]